MPPFIAARVHVLQTLTKISISLSILLFNLISNSTTKSISSNYIQGILSVMLWLRKSESNSVANTYPIKTNVNIYRVELEWCRLSEVLPEFVLFDLYRYQLITQLIPCISERFDIIS